MEYVQEFSLGLNKDFNKSIYRKGNYFDALNMSIMVEDTNQLGTPRNIRGNVLKVSLPGLGITNDTSNVTEITISSIGNGITYSVNLIDNFGTTTFTFTDTYGTLEDFYKALSDKINTLFNNTPHFIQSAYNGDHVVVWSQLNTGALPNQTITLTDITTPVTHLSINNTFITAQSNCFWIGWEKIRDDFYLFSTNDTITNPTSAGQVWRFTYDRDTLVSLLELIYVGKLNWSSQYPFANPGRVRASYENPSIQKIYLTNNFHPPLVFNTQDPNLMSIAPEDLEWTKNIAITKPILQNIIQSGGGNPSGIYEVGYRLMTTSGQSSNCSPISNSLVLLEKSESSSFTDYIGTSTASLTSKSLQYKITEIDTSFDRIQVLTFYRQNKGDSPEVNIVLDEPISGQSQKTVTLTGLSTPIPLSLEEVLTENIVFERVKTLAAKNDYLFPGNVTYGDFDVDFDARAFRFPASTSGNYIDSTHTNILDSIGSNTVVDISTPFNIPENHDSINPDQSPYSRDNYLYKANGTTFGGSGPNISYEFTNEYAGTSTYTNAKIFNLDTHHSSGSSSSMGGFSFGGSSSWGGFGGGGFSGGGASRGF